VRRGLVLGCGGTLGMSWSVAVLHELERALEWDAREAAVIVGTSAGAELACMLGGGVSVSELRLAQLGDPAAPHWLADHLRTGPGRLPPLPAPRLGSPRLLARAVAGRAPLLAGLCGALPSGRGDSAWLRRLAGRTQSTNGWVSHSAVWLVATDFDRGERVAFGSPGAPPAPLADALQASWAVPGWMPPVAIGGRRYVDGGVLSPASADLAAPLDLDELIVLAPMASSTPGRPPGALARAERIVRRRMTRTLDRELAIVEQRGTNVLRFEPAGRELAAMGGNFMDARRRAATLVSASASIRARLGEVPVG
jgi:NTE family protein